MPMAASRLILFCFVVIAAVVPGACKCADSDSTSPRTTVAICQQRASWANRLSSKCTKCVSLAPAPKGCKSFDKVYLAQCADQQRAKLDGKSCEPVFRCSYKCKRKDCDCVARCFEGHDKCDRLAAAVDGCVAEVCEPFCR